MIRISAFRWVPPVAQGYVRDIRVRWALEEAGLPYEVRLIGPEEQASAAYRRLQPFGQVPTYEEDGLVLFESGAIVHHVAERSAALMPKDGVGRARVTAWIFSALNSIEPFTQMLVDLDLFFAREAFANGQRQMLTAVVEPRLAALAGRLDGRDYLEGGRFTAADLMMASVLRVLRRTDAVRPNPVLEAYVDRCLARPAFAKALAAHLAPFAHYEAAVA